MTPASPTPPRWELAAEAIVGKIRWFGLVLGYLAVNAAADVEHRLALNAILAFGAGYTLLDSLYSLRGRVFLGRVPLAVSGMEALFIGLLCYFHGGLDSAFRFYYLLSLICAAIRHSAGIAHEVGNPLASISAIVQVLERRDHDDYTRAKLSLVADQLRRIQGILRELINFSRPASTAREKLGLGEVIDEALGIAKFYKG